MVIARLVDRIEVSRGYEIHIKLREALEQLSRPLDRKEPFAAGKPAVFLLPFPCRNSILLVHGMQLIDRARG